jgi:uncharacterized protein YndB with AHSA1/START domain
MTDTADSAIVTTTGIAAPRARGFEAWVDPAQVVRWWGPEGFTTTMQEMDVRPGGVWQFIMHGPDGKDYKNKSIFQEIVKPERIVYAHLSGPAFRMTATFDEQDGRTTVTMRMVFESAKERDQAVKVFGAVEGAKQTLARLGQHVMRPS